jgi:hypothetical protein
MPSEVASFYADNDLDNMLCLQYIICDVTEHYNNERLKILDE